MFILANVYPYSLKLTPSGWILSILAIIGIELRLVTMV